MMMSFHSSCHFGCSYIVHLPEITLIVEEDFVAPYIALMHSFFKSFLTRMYGAICNSRGPPRHSNPSHYTKEEISSGRPSLQSETRGNSSKNSHFPQSLDWLDAKYAIKTLFKGILRR